MEGHIKVYLIKTVCDGMKWINRDTDTVQWRALVNTVMSFRVT